MKIFAEIEEIVADGEIGQSIRIEIVEYSAEVGNAALSALLPLFEGKTYKKHIHSCGNSSDPSQNTPCIREEII
jgi:hypothetical protein